LGVKVYSKPITRTFGDKKFFIGHGDGLGPGQHKFKLVLATYRNHFFQRLFAFLHPSVGMGFANWLSQRSKLKTFDGNFTFYGEKEHLIQFCRTTLAKENFDFFVFGHRHLPMSFKLNDSSTYYNLGDWIGFNSYAEFDGTNLVLKTFEATGNENPIPNI
jgi:UDP-2,3-diacylglucosamine hydrolase